MNIADALLAIGGCYYDANEHDKSIPYLLKGYDKMKESGDKRGIAMASGYLGLIYYDKEDYNKAELYYLQYISLSKELGVKVFINAWLNNLGLIYRHKLVLTTNKDSAKFFHQEAMRYFSQARDQSVQMGRDNDLVQNLYILGSIYYDEGNLTEAIKLLNQTIELSTKTSEITYREKSHQLLATIYKKQLC